MADKFKDLMERYMGGRGSFSEGMAERRRKAEQKMATPFAEEKKLAEDISGLKEKIKEVEEFITSELDEVARFQAIAQNQGGHYTPDMMSAAESAADQVSTSIQDSTQELEGLKGRLSNKQGKLAFAAASRREGAASEYVSGVDVLTSQRGIASQISQIGQTPEAFGAAAEASQMFGTPTLMRRQQEARANIESSSEDLRSLAKRLQTTDDPKERLAIEQQMGQAEKSIQANIGQAAVTNRAIAERRAMGKDEYANATKAQRDTDRAVRDRGLEAARERGRSGEAGSVRDLTQKLNESFEKLVESNRELQEAQKEGGEAFEAASKNYEEAAQAYESAVQERRGAQEGGWLGPNIGGAITGIGQVMSAGGQVMRATQVDNPLDRIDMETGFAALENQRYGTMKAGLAGDARSLMKLGALGGRDQFAMGRAFADDISGWAGTAEALDLGGQTLQVGGNVVSNLSGEGNRLKKLVKMGTGGIATEGAVIAGQVAQGGAPILNRADRLVQNLPTGQTYLRAMQAFQARDDAGQEVNYQLMQAGINRMQMAGQSTRGFGGQRNNIMNQLLDPELNMEMAMAGLSESDIAQNLGIARSQLGADFGGDVGMITRAGRAAQSGLMDSASDYMSQVGALQAVSGKAGGGEERLQQIMQAAVAAGMDSSKNIREMARGVVSLSSRDAATGIDSSIGATIELARGTKTLTDAGMSASMAQTAALSTAKAMSDLSQDTSTSFGNVMEFESLRKSFGDRGISAVEMTAAAQLTPEQINATKAKFAAAEKAEKDGAENAKELREQAEKAAGLLGISFTKSADDWDRISDATGIANATNIMGIPGTGAYNSMMAALGRDEHGRRLEAGKGGEGHATWDAWFKQDKESAAIFARRARQRQMAPQAAFAQIRGASKEEVARLQEKYKDFIPQGVSGDYETGLGRSEQVGAAKELSAAAAKLSAAGSNFGEFNKAVNKLASSFKPEVMAESAERAAQTLAAAETGLGTKIEGLSGTVAQLATSIETFLKNPSIDAARNLETNINTGTSNKKPKGGVKGK